MKLHTILPGRLYQRGHLRDKTFLQKEAVLRHNNINYVVDLWSVPDPDMSKLNGIKYWHVPIPDGILCAPVLTLEPVAREVAALILNSPRAALTVCHAGRNRSGLMSALIVRQVLGISGERAMTIVREGRPEAIANPHFAAYLEGLLAPRKEKP
jgi:hypothetical protein